MRRWLALILLCLLPFQVSWAVVADYCTHEHGQAAQHFGHHDDEHQAWLGDADGQEQAAQSDSGHDCSHLSGFVGLLTEVRIPTSLSCQASQPDGSAAYPSLPPDQPERPQWTRPA